MRTDDPARHRPDGPKGDRGEASQERAFTVFTDGLGSWWPLDGYQIGAATPQTAEIEPRAGGRWLERGEDGTESDWGRVLVWDPPGRVVLSWQISSDWQPDPNLRTEVDVRFIPEASGRTRVELEHRALERYGDKAAQMRSIFDSPGGWAGLLEGYAGQVAA